MIANCVSNSEKVVLGNCDPLIAFDSFCLCVPVWYIHTHEHTHSQTRSHASALGGHQRRRTRYRGRISAGIRREHFRRSAAYTDEAVRITEAVSRRPRQARRQTPRMMRIEYDRAFEKQAAHLEPRLRDKLAALLPLLERNPYDSRLHTKPLSEPFVGILSFRITRDWRVSFCFWEVDTIRLLEVKHRKDIYR